MKTNSKEIIAIIEQENKQDQQITKKYLKMIKDINKSYQNKK